MPTFQNPESLAAWGVRLSRCLKKNDCLALVGLLGSGKTTLVQGIAQGWGYRARALSPTFSIVNEYNARKGLILHMDVYRLSKKEIEQFPFEDYWQTPSLCLIEWADRMSARMPKDPLVLNLKSISETKRSVTIHRPSIRWKKKLARLV